MIDWIRSERAEETWLIGVFPKIKVVLQQTEDGSTTIAWVVAAKPETTIETLNAMARAGIDALDDVLE